jgi:hypothetical protein
MSFAIATVLAIGACCVWMAYMAVNSNLQKHLRTFFVFMTLFGMIILINEARILARYATNNTDLNVLLEITHSSLIWFFGFIMAVYAIMAFTTYFKASGGKNEEVSISADQYRTR